MDTSGRCRVWANELVDVRIEANFEHIQKGQKYDALIFVTNAEITRVKILPLLYESLYF